MRLVINPTLNMETMTWLSRPSYEYCGPILSFKGDPNAQESEQAQTNFDKQLMRIFGEQYGKQSRIFDFLTGKMQSAVSAGGEGYRPEALAAMRTQSSDIISQQGRNAQQAFANQVSARSGGSKLAGVSGAAAAGEATIAADIAGQESSAQNAITLANEERRQQNFWNATNVLTGQQTVANPLGYSTGATSGGNTVANLSQAETAAEGPGVGQIIGGIVGGAAQGFAGGFGGGLAGLMGGAAKKKAPCWVAASFYGWDDPRTSVIRQWMLTKAPGWFRKLYIAYGERISQTPIRWLFRPLFETVLILEG